MSNITVWTKQSKNVLRELKETGRYTAKKEYVRKDMDDHSYLIFEVYNWLTANSPAADQRPSDAEYPVWVSFSEESTMILSEGTVILELSLDESLVTKININKWGTILNYAYIPADKQDAIDHQSMLRQYGISDAKAYMTQFYPQIKRKIVDSWSRLFDDAILLGSNSCYGNIWEIKKEWIKKII